MFYGEMGQEFLRTNEKDDFGVQTVRISLFVSVKFMRYYGVCKKILFKSVIIARKFLMHEDYEGFLLPKNQEMDFKA